MPRPCNVQDCEKPSWSSGLCSTHYRQFQRGARDHDGNLLREIRAKLPNGARKLDARGYVRSAVEALRILAVTYPACLDYQEQLLAA